MSTPITSAFAPSRRLGFAFVAAAGSGVSVFAGDAGFSASTSHLTLTTHI